MIKLLVTGAGGQLGYDIVKEALGRRYEVTGSDITEKNGVGNIQLDITDKDAVRRAIEELRPDAVINPAAWTAVDAAEDAGNQKKYLL